VIDAAAARFRLARHVVGQRSAALFAFRELLKRARRVGTHHEQRARKVVPTHSARSARPGGRRIRLRDPHLLKVDSPRTRRPSRRLLIRQHSARRHHRPVQLPGHGADVVFPIAIAAGNTVVLKPSRGPVASLWLAELWADAGLPPACSNVLQGDKTAVDALLTHLPIKAVSFVGSAQYVYTTATAHGKRVTGPGAGQRPRGDPARRDSICGRRDDQRRVRLRPVNAAWRSRPRSVGPSPTTSSPRSPNGPHHQDRRRNRRTPTWARWSPKRIATRLRPTSTPARPTAPRLASTDATSPPTAARVASGSDPR